MAMVPCRFDFPYLTELKTLCEVIRLFLSSSHISHFSGLFAARQEEPVLLDEGGLPTGEHLLQGDDADDLGGGAADVLGLGRRPRLPAHRRQLLQQHRHLQGAAGGGS